MRFPAVWLKCYLNTIVKWRTRISSCVCAFILLYAQFRLYLHPSWMYAVCILSPIYNLVVTDVSILGIIHFWNSTDLSIFYPFYIPLGHILLYVQAPDLFTCNSGRNRIFFQIAIILPLFCYIINNVLCISKLLVCITNTNSDL